MRICPKCGELVGENATKCFNCGKDIILTKKDACSYRCRNCGEPMEKASEKCRKCGGDAESIRPWSEVSTDVEHTSNSDSIGCLGYAVAILFTPISCIIAVLCYCSNGSEKAKQIAKVGAITFLVIMAIRFFFALFLL